MKTCQVCILPAASAVFFPFVGVGKINRNYSNFICFWILGGDNMEWMLALKAHDQTAWFGHFGGVVFDHIRSFQGLADFGWGYFTLEHALDGVGTVENSDHRLIINGARITIRRFHGLRRSVIARKINIIPTGFGFLACNILQSFHPFGIELLKVNFQVSVAKGVTTHLTQCRSE